MDLVDQVRELTQGIWESILGLELKVVEAGEGPDPDGGLVMGTIRITGRWEGLVILTCAERVAHRATSIMFDLGPGEAEDEHLQDAVGELTNLLGGTLKCLMPGASGLSLPTVHLDGVDGRVHHPEVLGRVSFACEGQPVVVTVLGGA